MPVPPQCQTFVDQIEELKSELEDVGDAVGAQKFQIAAHNHQIWQKIGQLQTQLSSCIIAFGGGYSTEVVVLDLTPGGGMVNVPLEATLWHGSAAVENRPVQGGKVSFANGPTAPFGTTAISVDESSNPLFTGPLCRTNQLGTLPPGSPGNPTGAITIVIPGPAPVSAATLAAAVPLSAIPPISGFTPTGITPTPGVPGPGLITVTITGLLLGFLPVTYAYVFTIVPSRTMTAVATTIVDVTPSPGTITSAAIGGFAGVVFSTLMAAVEPMLRAAVTPPVATAINSAIVSAATTFLGRPLTAFETISMRRVVITTAGITFFPTLCTYGP